MSEFIVVTSTSNTITAITQNKNIVVRDTAVRGPQGPPGTGAQGSQGAQGSPGGVGPQGPPGTGAQGSQGAQGSPGGVGPQGPQGVAGAEGAQGSPGTGAQGAQGDAGAPGPQGVAGEPGPAGGPQGLQGDAGPQGPQGVAGDTGPQGPQGDAGSQGAQGDAGTTGAQGAVGQQGFAGSIGPQGIQGAAGAPGPQGVQGAQGRQGVQGAQGFQGVQGAQGRQGAQGSIGVTGQSSKYDTFSDTVITIGTGTKQLNVETNCAYTAGQTLIASYGLGNTMIGIANTYNSTTGVLTLDVSKTTGSGTYPNSWGPTTLQYINFSGTSFTVDNILGENAWDNFVPSTLSVGDSLYANAVNSPGGLKYYGLITEIGVNSGPGFSYYYVVVDNPNNIAAYSSGNITFNGTDQTWLINLSGEIGPQGAQGATGPQGFQGASGAQGPQGSQGDAGPQGSQGDAGPQGSAANLLSVNTDIIPSDNVTYNIGSQDFQWNDLWVSNNTIFIGGIALAVANGQLTFDGIPIEGGGASLPLANGVSKFDIAIANGAATINANVFVWTFDETNGSIDLPGNVTNFEACSAINFVANSSGDGAGYSTIELRPDSNATNDQYLIIDPTVSNHIHIRAGGTQDNSNAQIFLGGEYSYFSIGSGLNPSAYVTANQRSWSFNNDGTITFPDSTTQNTAYTGGGAANTGNVTFDDNTIIGTGDGYGGGGLYLAASADQAANDQLLRIRAGDDPTHIHLDTGDSALYDQYWGDDGKYIKLEKGGPYTGNVEIKTNVLTWIFVSDGNLHLPGNIVNQNSTVNFVANTGDIEIKANNGVSEGLWTFESNGDLTVPGDIIPSANVTWNLGAPEARFKDLWLSNSTIHLGDATLNAVANAITTTDLRIEGTINVAHSITIGGNVVATQANLSLAYDQANAAYEQANTAGPQGPQGPQGVQGATGSASTIYFLEAYANETYTLPGSFTEDVCRYSVVSSNVNISNSWFNTSTYTFTPQKAGYWQITASYDVYRNTEASMAIKKNNSIVAAAGSFNAVAQQITKIVYLNGSTDYINIVNVGGAALQRAQFDSRSWFQARWTGE